MEKACELARTKGAKKAMPLPVSGPITPSHVQRQPKLESILGDDIHYGAARASHVERSAEPHSDPSSIRRRLVETVTALCAGKAMRYLLGQGLLHERQSIVAGARGS